jgi:hypothetical protein
VVREGRIFFFLNVLHQPGDLPRKAKASQAEGREEGQAASKHIERDTGAFPHLHLGQKASKWPLSPVLGTDTTQGDPES